MPQQNPDPASLANLHDVVSPAPSLEWPPAEGWLLLGGLAVVALIWLLTSWIKSWLRNRYRKEALRELEQIRASNCESNQQQIAAIDNLLKRVAIVSWPRESVAPLSGQSWLEFLQSSCTHKSISMDRIDRFRNSVYSSKVSEGLSPTEIEVLFEASRHWIKHHRFDETREREAQPC